MLTRQEKFDRYWQQQKESYKHFVSELIHNGILDIEEILEIIESHKPTTPLLEDAQTENHAAETPLPMG